MKNFLSLVFLCYTSLMFAQFSEAKLITNTSDGVRWIAHADIDGDGFQDIIAANRFGSNITWYKNVNAGESFVADEIGFLNQTSSVSTGDLDGDGDIDIIASSTPDQLLVWYENLDGLGTFSSQKTINSNTINAFFILIEDVDADGDLDVMTGGDTFRIEWYENTDGQANFSNSIPIDTTISSRYLAMEDLDGDGDLDLACTTSGSINIYWFENLDGNGNFSTKKEIGGNGLAASRVTLADFDNDNDIDVLAVYFALDRIVWHKNIDGLGNFGDQIDITLSARALGIDTGDIDNDGDIDIIASLPVNDELVFYENLDGQGTFSESQLIDSEILEGSRCLAVDMDNDGDLDVVWSAQNDDTIVWYENQLILSTAEAELEALTVYPNPTDTILFIKGGSKNNIAKMSITNILGKQVWSSPVFKDTITMQSWAAGIYFLEIATNDGQKKIFRVVKK